VRNVTTVRKAVLFGRGRGEPLIVKEAYYAYQFGNATATTY
jgi:hypothetical protein